MSQFESTTLLISHICFCYILSPCTNVCPLDVCYRPLPSSSCIVCFTSRISSAPSRSWRNFSSAAAACFRVTPPTFGIQCRYQRRALLLWPALNPLEVINVEKRLRVRIFGRRRDVPVGVPFPVGFVSLSHHSGRSVASSVVCPIRSRWRACWKGGDSPSSLSNCYSALWYLRVVCPPFSSSALVFHLRTI